MTTVLTFTFVYNYGWKNCNLPRGKIMGIWIYIEFLNQHVPVHLLCYYKVTECKRTLHWWWTLLHWIFLLGIFTQSLNMNDCCFSYHAGYWCKRCFGEVNICLSVWLVGWTNKPIPCGWQKTNWQINQHPRYLWLWVIQCMLYYMADLLYAFLCISLSLSYLIF